MKGQRIAWSSAELTFIKRRKKRPRLQLHAEFVEKFGRSDISLAALCSLCKRSGWLTGPRMGRFKGRSTAYSKAELTFIRRRKSQPWRQIHAAFVQEFGRSDVSFEKFNSLRKRLALRNGRDCRFSKGAVPVNKGKKMPFNANSALTRFKKGQLPRNTKYDGHERIDAQTGFVMVRVSERNPWTGSATRYLPKHHVLWREKHGPLPEGMVLKCKGDPLNTDPSNWEAVPRGLLPRLNGRSGRGYDDASADLKPTIMAVAKLEHRLREKNRSKAAS
jgi:hypothetical protein